MAEIEEKDCLKVFISHSNEGEIIYERRMAEIEEKDCLKVFISHSNEYEDRQLVAKEVAPKLEANARCKIQIYGQQHFTPGTIVLTAMTKIMDKMDRTLLFLSKNALKSPWCSFELLISLERSQRNNRLSVVLLLYDLDESELPHIPILHAAPKIHFTKGQDDWILEAVEGLQEQKSISHDALPAGNVAHGLVWSHYSGFLQYVLPELKDKLEGSEWYQTQSEDVRNKVSWKLYELVPRSCTCKLNLPLEDNNIKEVTTVLKKLVKRAGNERLIEIKLYSVTDGQETFYCMCEYPSVLSTMKKMEDNHLASFSHNYPGRGDREGTVSAPFTTDDKILQLGRFYYTMNSVVNHFSKSADRARILLFKDDGERNKKLSEILIEAIKEDLPRSKRSKEAVTQSPQLEKLESVENEFDYQYDVCIACSDNPEDEAKAKQIAEYLKSKQIDKILESDEGLVGKTWAAKLNTEVQKCRWFIFLLTKDAMHNEKLTFSVLAAVSDSIYRRKVRVIPIVDRSEDLYIPEALRWVTYIPFDENPDQDKRKDLKSLYSIVSGRDIQMETQMVLPAGDVAYGLAWGYVSNYLNGILPKVLEGIKPAFCKKTISSYRCPDKLYIIIPKSCYAPEELYEYKENQGRLVNVMKTDEVFPFGPGRGFSCNIYKISDSKDLYFVGQYAAPVTCLDEMRGWAIAGVTEETMSTEAERFYKIVSRLTTQAIPKKADFVEFIFFDDNEESLADIMQRKIREFYV